MCKNGDACKHPHVQLGESAAILQCLGTAKRGRLRQGTRARVARLCRDGKLCEETVQLPHVLHANRQQGPVNARSAPAIVAAGGSPSYWT